MSQRKPLLMHIEGIEAGSAREGYRPLTIQTSRGPIAYRYYPADGARRGAIWISGVGVGFDTPAQGLYPRMCSDLAGRSIASLWLCFRQPNMLEEAILDVLAGIEYLRSEGVAEVALIGWSFGGAVAIQAAAAAESVCAVVTLATQSYGVEAVAQLGPRCAILLLHGEADQTLPPGCSEYAYERAQDPRRLIRYPGAGHALDEVAEAVRQVVGDWVVAQLGAPPA